MRISRCTHAANVKNIDAANVRNNGCLGTFKNYQITSRVKWGKMDLK